MTDQARFDYLCHRLLNLNGNNLTGRPGVWLTSLKTSEGTVYIKQTPKGMHVSTPNYLNGWTIYERKTPGTIVHWFPDRAAEIVPLLEKKLALDLLADI